MTKIHLLDDELINKIAAGEVVERPASVVKELVENAIDAGARHIKVSLKDGGRLLIQVQDDGSGMDAADAALAVKRHTTSKLSRADDLFEVRTMGFRGEALASIASVSRFTLQTQTSGAAAGTRLVMEDGVVQTLPWQGPLGTTLTVADLFYNVPVRKTFMKTAAAEFAACHEYMQALALSLPEVGFTLVHNDKEILSVSPLPTKTQWPRGEQPLRQRAEALFGKELVQGLVYIHKKERYAGIEGLISAPGQDKGSAKYIFTFVNQRWVRDKLLRYGIMRGYHSHILKGKFPIAFLYLDMEAALVDVNVHPAKAELRFQYGSEVQNTIALALREGLRTSSWAEAPDGRSEELQAKSRPAAHHEVESQAKPQGAPLPDDFDLMLGPAALLPPAEELSEPPQTEIYEEARDLASPSRTHASEPSEAKGSRERVGASVAPARPYQEKGSDYKSARDAVQSGIKRTTMSFYGHSTPGSMEAGRDAGGGSESIRASIKLGDRAAPPSPSWTEPKQAVPLPPVAKAPPEPPLERSFAEQTPASVFAPLQSEARGADEGAVIPWDELEYIGAFARCFLLFECRGQMLAVDQHAFHERILYERLSRNPELLARTQPLLMPEVLEFSPSEVAELREQSAQFAQWGLHYTVVSDAEIELKAVPSLLTQKDLGSLVHALLVGTRGRKELAHDVLATMACHAAVRAGEDLPPPELKALLSEARTVDFYHNCPHGRRVFRWWKQSQVAAWFDRLS